MFLFNRLNLTVLLDALIFEQTFLDATGFALLRKVYSRLVHNLFLLLTLFLLKLFDLSTGFLELFLEFVETLLVVKDSVFLVQFYFFVDFLT